jgi:DNA-binding PadR family transcriptional regulator
MSINYAILGILSYKSMSGYDLKKIIQDSSFMHWSGNNNQIYKALVELLEKGMVTNEVMHQESSPSKKVYTITSKGLASLKEWVLIPSEASEIRKPFLVHLAWSKQLNTRELTKLIDEYENQIKIQVLMHQNKKQQMNFQPSRSELETTIWNLIDDNIRRSNDNELVWIQELRTAIARIPNENDSVTQLDVKVTNHNDNNSIPGYIVMNVQGKSIIYYNATSNQPSIRTERNILDVISACAEYNTQFVIFDRKVLSDEFFHINSSVAASLLQKMTLYHMKVTILFGEQDSRNDEIERMYRESVKHNIVRFFSNKEEATDWFLSMTSEEG